MAEIAGDARRRDAAEVVALPQRVPQGERDRVEHAVAERDAVLPHRLAIGRVADGDNGHVRQQGIDHQFARRRRPARRDDDEPLQRERLGLLLESHDGVAKGVLLVVEILREHLPVGPQAADQRREVLGDRHEAAAVVAQVEHEFLHLGLAQRRERHVERLDRRLDEVAEEHVADLAAVDLVDLRGGHGRNRHGALRHGRLDARPVGVLEGQRDLVAVGRRPDGRPELSRRDEFGQRHAGDGHDPVAAQHPGLGGGTAGEHLRDAVVGLAEDGRVAEADVLARRVERVGFGLVADVAEGVVEVLELDRVEVGVRARVRHRVGRLQLGVPVVDVGEDVAHEQVLRRDRAVQRAHATARRPARRRPVLTTRARAIESLRRGERDTGEPSFGQRLARSGYQSVTGGGTGFPAPPPKSLPECFNHSGSARALRGSLDDHAARGEFGDVLLGRHALVRRVDPGAHAPPGLQQPRDRQRVAGGAHHRRDPVRLVETVDELPGARLRLAVLRPRHDHAQRDEVGRDSS